MASTIMNNFSSWSYIWVNIQDDILAAPDEILHMNTSHIKLVQLLILTTAVPFASFLAWNIIQNYTQTSTGASLVQLGV
jgi:hypothetical protein